MKRNTMTSLFKAAFLFCLLALPAQSAMAQDPFDDNVDDTTPQAFIDGFLGLGLAAGAVYGYSRFQKNK